MVQTGYVTSIQGEYAVVSFKRQGGCGDSCASCKLACASAGVTTEIKNTLGAKIGDKVKVEMKQNAFNKMLLWVYVFPLIMLAIGITSLFVYKIKDYTRVVALINIMGTGILIWYFLSGSRFPAWVSGPIYLFASFVFILYAGGVKDVSLQYEKKAIVRLLKQIKENIFLICLLICMSINNQIFNSIAEVNYYNPDLKDAIEYCEKTDEVILLDNISNAPYPYIDTRGALYAYQEGQWDNIIRVGNWDVGHPEREKQKETLGIDSVIYSMAEGKSKLLSQEGSASFNRYTIFFKEHYGLDVYFELERSFGNYGIYRCVCN